MCIGFVFVCDFLLSVALVAYIYKKYIKRTILLHLNIKTRAFSFKGIPSFNVLSHDNHVMSCADVGFAVVRVEVKILLNEMMCF